MPVLVQGDEKGCFFFSPAFLSAPTSERLEAATSVDKDSLPSSAHYDTNASSFFRWARKTAHQIRYLLCKHKYCMSHLQNLHKIQVARVASVLF